MSIVNQLLVYMYINISQKCIELIMGFILLLFGMLIKFAIDIIRLLIEKILNKILRKLNR